MNVYLQFGWGMMELSRELTREWGAGTTTILSPRDLEPSQCVSLGADITELGGRILFDPQFYMPHSVHKRLTSHEYWPEDYDTQGFDRDHRMRMAEALARVNLACNSSALIIPGERAVEVNQQWLANQQQFYETIREVTNLQMISTICLSPSAILEEEQLAQTIELARSFDVTGYYLVLEHPEHEYLVTNPLWLANCLDLVVGLKRTGKNVIVGYANQQQLMLACAKADAIATGNWMNVRSFPPDKFTESEDVKQRSNWYYTAQLFSEFTLPFMDLGIRRELRETLRSRPNTRLSEIPFNAPRPSASGFDEPSAFRHFLHSMRAQAQDVTLSNFDEAVIHFRTLLNEAEAGLTQLHRVGVDGKTRDFFNSIDATRAALITLEDVHGPILRHEW